MPRFWVPCFLRVHPVQTASVAYVSGRKDLLAAFFLLLASLLYIQWRRRRGWPRGVFTGLAVFLAVLSKEVAVVFPVLFVLIDLCGSRKSFRAGDGKGVTAALKKSARLYTLLATVAIAAVYYAVVWTEASRMAGYWGGSLAAQWATSFKLFVHYLSLALMPYPLLADYTGVFPISTGLTEAATLVCVLISAAYLGLAVWLLRRRPLVTLGMGWFLVPLLPVLQIVGFHEIAADHFLYLPMVGAALVFGNLGAEAAASPKANVLAKAFLLAIFVLGSILTVSRNLDGILLCGHRKGLCCNPPSPTLCCYPALFGGASPPGLCPGRRRGSRRSCGPLSAGLAAKSGIVCDPLSAGRGFSRAGEEGPGRTTPAARP